MFVICYLIQIKGILFLILLFTCSFYFVGDEDLLEIIGNSKNIARLQKHFKKMFAGVAAIILNDDNTIINGIASREGEEVCCHVDITEKGDLSEFF